jgi:hypothetical protein
VFFQAWSLAVGKHARYQPAPSLGFCKISKYRKIEKYVDVSILIVNIKII